MLQSMGSQRVGHNQSDGAQDISLHWASRVPQLAKNPPSGFNSWVSKIRWRRDRISTPVLLGFSGGSDGKQFSSTEGDLGLIPGLVRSPGGGHGNPLQYSCLENPVDGGDWWATSPLGRKESDMTERLYSLKGTKPYVKESTLLAALEAQQVHT